MKNKDSVFRIEVERLRKDKILLEVDEPPESLDLNVEDYRFQGRLTGQLTYSMSGDDILIFGSLRAEAVGQCVRCLDPAVCHVEAKVGLAYLPGPAEQDEGLDEEGESAILDYYEGDLLDPSEQLRELILLELPALPLCGEQCKGLCPQCGANLNHEPCSCDSPEEPVPEEDAWKAKLRNLRLK